MIFSNAIAQEAAAQAASPAAQQSPLMSFVPFILIFLVFYFLLIKPQKKRLQEEQTFNQGMQKGDEIYTKSGVIGTIAGITEKVVTLEISEGVKIKLLRSQVAGSAKNIFSSEKK